MRPRTRIALEVEALERKALLSSAGLPVLTKNAFAHVLTTINHAAFGLSIDRTKSNFISFLTGAAPLVPFGRRRLLPIWENDVDIFDPTVKGSGGAMVAKIKSDLAAFVAAGVASGEFVVKGR